MAARRGLGSQKIVAFAGARDAKKAKKFYRDTLGLRLVSEDGFAVVFNANGTMLRVTTVPEMTPAKYTVLGWEVADIEKTAKSLAKAGVTFNRYKGMPQDELGVWTSPSGARVAWFHDPDGNILSISQF